MTETLFINKYQPLYFDDFEENKDVINMLKMLIQIDNIHILLIGNIATGKTSLLNALIREYYAGYPSKKYQENVLYINSLKEQGINYYRTDVKTFCQTRTNIPKKKKFVVLDDIDFINEQSQQVFRNFIDKFSHNVHFVATCTNIQKVIESLQSRLLLSKIQQLQQSSMIHIIDKIKEREHIDIDEDAKQFILQISNNSVKTIINYMEKFKLLNERITLPLANQLCTNISMISFNQFTNCILQHQLNDAIRVIYDIYDKGYSVMDILDNYFLFIKITDLLQEDQKYKIIPYLCKYITIFHNVHEDEIELALFTNNLIKILH
jgi:DNA polymerase III delta prime subunit